MISRVQAEPAEDIAVLLALLPELIRGALERHPDLDSLLEIVLDLGRPPEARFPDGTVWLGEDSVSRDDLAHATAGLGPFTSDNRAGIERTLHRISAIRNRASAVIGLTCRVGRAVFGTVEILRDVIESGRSTLLLGPPGVGKTTLLREAARVLADELGKRVIVVDTSNEIAGDGDIPHPGIGRARRMQVSSPDRQHAVMIEAVENHMPEVIVIDEIGTEAESAAARTIAERGVQLLATAHGHSLDNLLSNPTLADLLGGVEAVTLGDAEARRRQTQKTALERRQPPTFDILVEIQERDRLAVHHDVARVVDALLRHGPVSPEIRVRRASGEVDVYPPEPSSMHSGLGDRSQRRMRIYPYAVAEERLARAIRATGAPAEIAKSPRHADLILTLRSYAKRQPTKLRDALAHDLPVHMLRSQSTLQLEGFLTELSRAAPEHPDGHEPFQSDGEAEAEAAARRVHEVGAPIVLGAQPARTRRQQHAVAERNGLTSVSRGRDPRRRVVLMPRKEIPPDQPTDHMDWSPNLK